MSERGTKVGKVSNSGQSRMKRIEASFKAVALRLKRAESRLKAEAGRARELERRFSTHIAEVRKRLGEKGAAKNPLDGLVTPEQGYGVDLEEWERKMDARYSLLTAKEQEVQELEKKICAEVDKCLAEIKQRDLLLAAREVEIRSLKQGLDSRLDELENLVNKRGGVRRAARLVSFLVDIGKKH